MKKHIRTAAILLTLLTALVVPAQAAAPVETARTCSLTLSHLVRGEDNQSLPLSGVAFRLYRVGDMSENVIFSLTGGFADYPVRVNGLDADGWNAAAGTLAAYAGASGIQPRQTVRTDGAGLAYFSDLATGLYLLTGDDVKLGETTYRVAPFLVSLPGWEGGWVYDVDANTKPDGTQRPPQTELTAIKVWNDQNSGSSRPERVEAVLRRDGQEADRVELSADNFWRHTWSELDPAYTWTVTEGSVPAGYWVTYTGNEFQIVITNTYHHDDPNDPGDPTPNRPHRPNEPSDPDTPDVDIPDEPVPEGGTPPNTPGTPGDPGTPEVEIPDTPPPLTGLPQTGLLWWPVPVMAAAGLLLFGLGWWRRNGGQSGHED